MCLCCLGRADDASVHNTAKRLTSHRQSPLSGSATIHDMTPQPPPGDAHIGSYGYRYNSRDDSGLVKSDHVDTATKAERFSVEIV